MPIEQQPLQEVDVAVVVRGRRKSKIQTFWCLVVLFTGNAVSAVAVIRAASRLLFARASEGEGTRYRTLAEIRVKPVLSRYSVVIPKFSSLRRTVHWRGSSSAVRICLSVSLSAQ